MKIFISIMLTILLLLSFSIQSFASGICTNCPGDINFDGIVTSTDARLILRYAVGLETLTPEQMKYADINGDNEVNSADARSALRVSVGIESQSNVVQEDGGISDEETFFTSSVNDQVTDESNAPGSYESEVLRLVNVLRKENGLAPLQWDAGLAALARQKSEDMRDNNYFSHESPTYGTAYDMMDANGMDFMYAGENLAIGYPTPQEAVNAWYASDGHRANLLSAHFTRVGISYVAEKSYCTQMFTD